MSKYMGLFESGRDAVWREFNGLYGDEVAPDSFPSDDAVIVSVYEYESYSGDAFVLFEDKGALYEVHGGHCSCYGLEGQWQPEETTEEALKLRYIVNPPAYPYGVQHSPAVVAILSQRFGWGK